jgi:hypothetical protein
MSLNDATTAAMEGATDQMWFQVLVYRRAAAAA